MLFARSNDPPVLATLVTCAHPPPMLQQQHYLLRGIRGRGKQQSGRSKAAIRGGSLATARALVCSPPVTLPPVPGPNAATLPLASPGPAGRSVRSPREPGRQFSVVSLANHTAGQISVGRPQGRQGLTCGSPKPTSAVAGPSGPPPTANPLRKRRRASARTF